MFAIFLCACAAIGQPLAEEPVTFEFKRKSGPADGRKQAFDPKTQIYHLHLHDIARFEIKAVSADLEKPSRAENYGHVGQAGRTAHAVRA